MAKFRVEDARGYLEMSLDEVLQVGENSEDVGVRATVAWNGPSGSVSASISSLWFSGSDYEAFLDDLRLLERTRRGAARLQSLSPEEFWLEILAVDRLGHVHARGQLKLAGSAIPESLRSTVGFDIELDPTTLPLTVREFERLPERPSD